MNPFLELIATTSWSGPWRTGGWNELYLLATTVTVFAMGIGDFTSGLIGRFSDDDQADDDSESDDVLDDDESLADEFGGTDDWDDDDALDDFGEGGDGAESSTSNLEPRLDELENEVENISSTVGTVRSENEAISETVDEIEDNIRQLLDIYEMVTRGVNPFVDDVQEPGGVGDSFGLFDAPNNVGDDVDDLDPDIAAADPDSFFDDDWEDDPSEADQPEADSTARTGTLTNETPDAPADSGSEDDEDGGKTFEDLKSEYEKETDQWQASADETSEETGRDQQTGGNETTTTDPDERAGDTRTVSEPAPSTEPARSVDTTDDVQESTSSNRTNETPPEEKEDGRHGESRDGKPYLRELPAGYGADVIVFEWLTYLNRSSSTAEALRAIRYYETLGWISGPAAETLKRFLSGLPSEETAQASAGETQLTVDHHTTSLRYIGRLSGTDVQVERLEWTTASRGAPGLEKGEEHGLQR